MRVRPTFRDSRLGLVLAVVAACLGALAPVLGALHAASHETPGGSGTALCAHEAESAPATVDPGDPGDPSHPSPDRRAPHHECPVCVLLTTAFRQAMPAEPGQFEIAPAPEAGAVVLTAGESPSRPVRLSSRPRAPPCA
ncbi:MAG: DUF2946 family protein [Phycisphaerales bacterium]|nr:DUF2946 family protein [Phycisphaerales bacterium]